MEIIDLGENVRIIISTQVILLQRNERKNAFKKNTFLYFMLSIILLILLMHFLFGFLIESIVLVKMALFFIIPEFRIEELEINIEESFIKRRYYLLGKAFFNKTLFYTLNEVRFILLPGEESSNDEDRPPKSTFELVGKMRHFKHIDLFLFYHKENALKLIPIFRDQLGIEIIEDLNNFIYLK